MLCFLWGGGGVERELGRGGAGENYGGATNSPLVSSSPHSQGDYK
jgi:hypothetical protein